jgi:nucleolar MIF4G domain-containing protein 1
MRDELELAATEKRSSGFEESDLGEKRGPGGARGDGGRGGRGGRGGKGTVLDRKQQRKLAKEREKAQRQQWSERKARVKARDGGGGGGAGDGTKARDDSKPGAGGRKRGKMDDREDARDSGKRAKKSASSDADAPRPSSSRRRLSDDASERRIGDSSRDPIAAKRAPAVKTQLAPERRMSRAVLDAYRRDEAEQKRLLKRLKGRQKGPDDGLGSFFESLPGLELLADDADEKEKADEEKEKQRRALRAAATTASRRPKVTLDSDEEDLEDVSASEDDGDPFGMGGSDFSDEDDEDEDSDSDGDSDGDADDDSDDDGKSGVVAAPSPSIGKTYVPPALRAAMAAESAKARGVSPADAKAAADAETAKRQVRGLMNRMGEANVPSIVSGVAALRNSLPRRAVGDAATEEALKALVDGPRASSQYASVIAAFVAGLAGALGPEAGARFGAALVAKLDEARGLSYGRKTRD